MLCRQESIPSGFCTPCPIGEWTALARYGEQDALPTNSSFLRISFRENGGILISLTGTFEGQIPGTGAEPTVPPAEMAKHDPSLLENPEDSRGMVVVFQENNLGSI